jgi:hypothetical protein
MGPRQRIDIDSAFRLAVKNNVEGAALNIVLFPKNAYPFKYFHP